MRDGFIIHEKTLKQMAYLEPEDKGYLMNLLTQHYYGEEIDLAQVEKVSPIVAVVYIDASERMDADASAYDETSKKRINSAKKAAAARWSKECEEDAENANASNRICEEDAENAVSDSVSDSVSVSEKKKKGAHFAPPSPQEVREYCAERGYAVDAEAFCDYYQSNGWKVGRNPMKDWKAAARTWEYRDRGKTREPPKKAYQIEGRKYDNNELERMLLGGKR